MLFEVPEIHPKDAYEDKKMIYCKGIMDQKIALFQTLIVYIHASYIYIEINKNDISVSHVI
jgi:hypothetical protein